MMYRKGIYDPTPAIMRIEDVKMRELLFSLV
jgi:hypothetical protein